MDFYFVGNGWVSRNGDFHFHHDPNSSRNSLAFLYGYLEKEKQ